MTDATLLQAAGVTKRFGGRAVVDGVSLALARGAVVGLVGANGAGKTTLIRMLLGLLAPDGGRVHLLGGPPTRERRARTGYVPQGLGLWVELSTREHLALISDVYARPMVDPADAALRAEQDRPVGELPLGLRRRAACAVALAHAPDLLVLDEPTSGMDPLGRHRLWELLRATADGGAGVLVSTHHLAEAERCDLVVLLAAGQVVAAGPPAELARGSLTVQITTESWERAWSALESGGFAALPVGRGLRVTGTGPEAVSACLATAGVTAQVTAVPATLEEVFLQMAAA